MATHDNAIGAMQGGGGGGGASYDKTAVVQGMRESLAAHELADALGHRGAAAQVEQIENMWEQVRPPQLLLLVALVVQAAAGAAGAGAAGDGADRPMREQNSVSGSFGAECQATDCAWYNR